MSGPTVTMADEWGNLHDVPADQVQSAQISGQHIEGADEQKARLEQEAHREYLDRHPIASKVFAGGLAALRGASLGLSDVAMNAVGGRQFATDLKDYAPTVSTVGEIAGALATAIPTGGGSLLEALPARGAAKLGARLAEVGEGAGALTKVTRAALGGTAEGSLYGLGAGASDLALDDQKITWEHAASVLSSNMLYGAGTGGVLGGAGKAVELGLGRAKNAIDGYVANREALQNVPDDLSQLDMKGLQKARAAEVESIKATQEAERAQVNAGRETDRKSIADDIAAHRKVTNTDKPWLAIKDAEGVGETGAILYGAEKDLRRLTNNPKKLADNPKLALGALQQQEHGLEEILRVEPQLRTTVAADEAGMHAKALDTVPQTLERNRQLQQRIREVTSDVKLKTPDASPRLTQIDEAKELLAASKGGEKTLAEQMVSGSVFGMVSKAAHAIPVVGPYAAAFLGAKASRLVTDQVFGRLGKAAAESQLRMAKSVGALLSPAAKAVKATVPVATQTLTRLRYAAGEADKESQRAPKGRGDLAQLYLARANEVRSQMMPGPDGRPVMRPDARAQLATRLKPIAVADPVAADRIETIAARKLELLANALPKRPDVMANAMGGPDLWKPSDMQMRKWARLAHAAEDPAGVIERLAAGHVTPDDVLAMRTVYPEIHADITKQVMAKLPTLRSTLSYERRLALSRFTGQPVDASMHPRILAVLQGSFVKEQGTDGGVNPPMPKPNFGVFGSAPKTGIAGDPTAAQKRAG